MRIATRKLLMYVCVSALIISVGAQRVRVIDNKGTITEIDTSKWQRSGADIYNGNAGNVGIGINAPKATLHNAGSTILGSIALGDFAVSGDLGTAAATVDTYSGAVITQNTAGISLSLPYPTPFPLPTTPGRIFQVSNSNTSTQAITVGGVTLAPGSSTLFRWDGGAWSTLTVANSSLVRNNIITGTSSASATDPLTLGGGYTNALVGGSNASFAVNNTAPLWNANQLQGVNISTSAPGNGQLLGYNGTNWSPVSPSSYGWLLNGNSGLNSPANPATYGTTPLTSTENWIGTTDVKDFVIGTQNIERLRVKSDGSIGIGTATTAANSLLTINPTTNSFRNGISLNLSGASSPATGISINSSSSNVNGLLITNSSGATTTAFYGAGAVLNNGNIVSGYMGYRNGSGVSYGLYGAGTNTNVNTYAAFLQGRTVISSGSAPTSLLGVDLEIRNTTIGAGNPSTLSLRQTTSNTTGGTTLAKINFGDNYSTSDAPQAQIQAIRDVASSSSSDLPTALTFSTTPDGSATMAERMRISNAGYVGIGTAAPTALLHINSGSSPAFRLVDGTQGAGKILTSDANGNAAWTTPGAGSGWSLTGNSGTTGANFVGTTDDKDLTFRRYNAQAGLLGSTNTAFGYLGANALTTGSDNVAIGHNAMSKVTTTGQNVVIGKNAMSNSDGGWNNVAVGYQTLLMNTWGGGNTALGYMASSTLTSGKYNTAVGYNANAGQTGTNNIAIGNAASVPNSTADNQLSIGNTIYGLNMGQSGTSATPPQIGIATTNPTFTTPSNTGATIPTLGVDGTVNATNYTSPVKSLGTTSTIAWDLSTGASATVTLSTTAPTLSLSNLKAGMYGTLVITNNGTTAQSTISFGSSTISPSGTVNAANNKVINGGGNKIYLTPTTGAIDIACFFFDGTYLYWTIGNNYN